MIPDFTSIELNVIQQALNERFGRTMETHLVDTELRLNPPSPELTSCPAVYWETDDCHFIISKIDDSQYHCMFYYSEDEFFHPGKPFYNDIMECVLNLLRAQADHELKTKGGL